MRGLVCNFYIHVSVYLYIHTIGPKTQCGKIVGPTVGMWGYTVYNLLTYAEIGKKATEFRFWEYCFEFSVRRSEENLEYRYTRR
jgi:hypothetical protein